MAGSRSKPARKPWEQRPDENALWYSRFYEFLIIGPGRALTVAHQLWRDRHGRPTQYNEWTRAARKWDWWDRANAFDDHTRQQRALAYAKELLERDRKLHGICDTMLDQIKTMWAVPLHTTSADGKVIKFSAKLKPTATRALKVFIELQKYLKGNVRLDAEDLLADGEHKGPAVASPEEDPHAALTWLDEMGGPPDPTGDEDIPGSAG